MAAGRVVLANLLPQDRKYLEHVPSDIQTDSGNLNVHRSLM
jgi:hypothetical protein